MSRTTEQLIQMDFSEEMRNSFRDYAISVIIARALPDVRDGLKPVQRRILYAMSELGLDPKKPHRKSARIVGDTMGKYHPHGDSSIYDALVHLSQEYSLSLPLVDGHGNFGSIDGDGAAAMRYTEARLSDGAMTLLENLDTYLVEFVPNFDDSEKEPTVLPALLPNLLINGTTGIAVGMATNMPPHNPAEVIDGAMAFLDNPDISTNELMEYIKGPDFPTGGVITNSELLKSIYETGEGKIRVRAKTELENGENGRRNIVITEIPYTAAGNKTKLVESIVAMMKDKVFDEIYDVRDESSKEGIRIVIEVKKDRDVNNLLNGLYKKTSMEDTYPVNMLAVKDKQPITFNLKTLLQEFILFQEELYTREHRHLLDKAEKRLEIVGGLIRATDVIDLIIEILRGSSSLSQAKKCLIHGDITDIKFKSDESAKQAAGLDFSERQAEAILAMPLSRLVGLEILKLHEENDSIKKSIDEYRAVLSDKKKLYKVIKGRLKDFRKQFDRPRRTELLNLNTEEYAREFKVEEICVLVDKFGYTKSMDAASFNRVAADGLKDFVHIIRMKNNDRLCIFTAEGNMFQVKAAAVPRCKLKEKGVLIQNLCKVDKEEIIHFTAFEDLFESQLLFTTKNGYVKQVSGVEFETVRAAISSTKLDDGDTLVSVVQLSASEITGKKQKVVLLTRKGLSLGFSLDEVSEFKKTSRGVKGISLDPDDSVVYAASMPVDSSEFIYNGKELSAKKVKLRSRGAKGQKASLQK